MLLATFVRWRDIDDAIIDITKELGVDQDRVFIIKLVNKDDRNERKYVLTFNWYGEDLDKTTLRFPDKWPTISIHRKRHSNTLYTINALNVLCGRLEPGKPPQEVKVPWSDYRNTMLISRENDLKQYSTYIVKRSDIDSEG